MLHSALPPCSKVCRPAIFGDFLAPNFVARRCLLRAGALLRVCRLVVQQRHNAVLVLRSGCCRGRGCKEGAGGTLPPAVLVRKFVSGCAVRAEVRLWAGSQPVGFARSRPIWEGISTKRDTKRTCATQFALKHIKCATFDCAVPTPICYILIQL